MFCDLFGGMENCDWGLTTSIIKDIITIVSIIVATGTGITGVNIWRKQFVGKENNNLAKKILILLYRLREEFRYVRNPYMGGGENSEAIKELRIQEYDWKEDNMKVVRWVFVIRFRKLIEIYNELSVLMFSIEALWAKEINEDFNVITKIVRELGNEIDSYGKHVKNPESMERNEKIVFGIKGDEFDIEMVKAVNLLDEKIKPYLISTDN
jgi:hypothetical protein